MIPGNGNLRWTEKRLISDMMMDLSLVNSPSLNKLDKCLEITLQLNPVRRFNSSSLRRSNLIH